MLKKNIELMYDGCLTKQKLIKLFKDLSKHVKLKVEINVNIGSGYKVSIILNDKYMVEFDDYRHYTKALIVNRDSSKNAVWQFKDEDVNKVIRIPYFVQLNNEAFEFFFGDLMKELNIEVQVIRSQPHGFIGKKVVLPADFCTYGERRFVYEVWDLPHSIYVDIMISLVEHLIDKEAVEVFPLNIRELEDFNEMFEWVKTELECDPFEYMNWYFRFREI